MQCEMHIILLDIDVCMFLNSPTMHGLYFMRRTAVPVHLA